MKEAEDSQHYGSSEIASAICHLVINLKSLELLVKIIEKFNLLN